MHAADGGLELLRSVVESAVRHDLRQLLERVRTNVETLHLALGISTIDLLVEHQLRSVAWMEERSRVVKTEAADAEEEWR